MTTPRVDYWPTEPGRLDVIHENDRVTRYTVGGWSGCVVCRYYPDSAVHCVTTHNAHGQILGITRIVANPGTAAVVAQTMTLAAAKQAGIETTL